MGLHGSTNSPFLFPCRADAGTHNAWSPELDGRRSARPSSILMAGSTPLPLRGSATVESSPPLHWGEAASDLGVGASAIPMEGEAEACLTAS
jgi:hypothetical protein